MRRNETIISGGGSGPGKAVPPAARPDLSLDTLTLEDLVITCPKCQGSNNIVERQGNMTRSGPCDNCEEGLVLTNLGRVMREFDRKLRGAHIL